MFIEIIADIKNFRTGNLKTLLRFEKIIRNSKKLKI